MRPLYCARKGDRQLGGVRGKVALGGAGNKPLWRKEFGAEAALAAIRVDPTAARRLVLCGARGTLVVLRLTNLARDRAEQQQYKVGCLLGRQPVKPCPTWARRTYSNDQGRLVARTVASPQGDQETRLLAGLLPWLSSAVGGLLQRGIH